MKKLILTACAVAALVSAPAIAAEVVVTDLVSPTPAGTSWGTLPGENTGTVAITSAASRSGNGSLEIKGDRTRAQTGIQYMPFTTNIGALRDAQSLTFDWQVASDSGRLDYTPALRLLAQDGLQRSELIWEGVYNAGVTPGTFANANAAGLWYSTTADDKFWQFVADAGANQTGGALVLMTIAQWAASSFYTGNATISGLSAGAGSGAGVNYHAYADNVNFTKGAGSSARSSGSTNFNFEVVSAVPEPGTWGMMLVGFGAVGYSMRQRRVPGRVSLV